MGYSLMLFVRLPPAIWEKQVELITSTAKVPSFPPKWVAFDWWTEYSAKNETETDALWEAILPSHGVVAVDYQWASDHHWPDSMALPADESKRVYLLEAYHLLHCVVCSLPAYVHHDHILTRTENHSKDILGSCEERTVHLPSSSRRPLL